MRRRYKKKYKNQFTLLYFMAFSIMYSTLLSFGLERAIVVMIVIVTGVVLFKLNRRMRVRSKYLNSGMKEVDTMSGTQFESFLLAHFEKLGYKGNTTQASNDFGADLVLKKEGICIVIQAKRHKGKIGISAVQEVTGAIHYYKATKGIVVTNSFFTPAAVKLADASQIELWDRKKLSEIMKANKKENIQVVTESKQENTNPLVDLMICPRCKSNLLERSGKYGNFLGCSNFPDCAYTQSINESVCV